jgi:ABC-type hemin transport system ATPase subunit
VRACDNPFRVQRLGALAYRLAGTTWEELLKRAERLGFRAAIVGPEGHGKSTLLAEIGARIAAARGLALR